jgi:hypothetical protein
LSSKYNGSGCRDLTAHEAVEHVSQEEAVTDDKVHLTISIIKAILKLAGLKQVNRLILKDKKSGRTYN